MGVQICDPPVFRSDSFRNIFFSGIVTSNRCIFLYIELISPESSIKICEL